MKSRRPRPEQEPQASTLSPLPIDPQREETKGASVTPDPDPQPSKMTTTREPGNGATEPSIRTKTRVTIEGTPEEVQQAASRLTQTMHAPMRVKSVVQPPKMAEVTSTSSLDAISQKAMLSDEAVVEQAMQSPDNRVEVRRIRPRYFPGSGRDARVIVYREECPLSLREVMDEVYAQYGGEKYRVAVVDSRGRLVAATTQTDPECRPPKESEEPIREVGPDPFLVGTESEDEIDEMNRALNAQIRRMSKLQELEQKKIVLQQMRDSGAPSEKTSALERQIAQLQEELRIVQKSREEQTMLQTLQQIQEALKSLKSGENDPNRDEMRKRLEALERAREEQTQKLHQQQMELLSQLIRTSQERSDRLVELLLQRQTTPNPPAASGGNALDADLERIKKLAEITQMNQKPKDSLIYDVATDVILQRLRTSGGASEAEAESKEGVFGTIVRELAPALRELLESEAKRRVNAMALTGRTLTETERQLVYRQAWEDFATQVRQGKIRLATVPAQQNPLPPNQASRPGNSLTSGQATPTRSQPPMQQPQPPSSPLASMTTASAQSPFNPLEVLPTTSSPPSHLPATNAAESGNEVPPHSTMPHMDDARGVAVEGADPVLGEIPPPPGHPQYDRSRALSFVLRSILHEAENGCPMNGYAVGDALERLDNEVLDGLSAITTEDQMKDLLTRFAAPQDLVNQIQQKAKSDRRIQIWLRNVIASIQYGYEEERMRRSEHDAQSE